MSRVLIVRQRSDFAEKVLSSWADRFRQEVDSAPSFFEDVELDDLLGPGLTPAALQPYLGHADLVLFYGHGTKDALGAPALVDGHDAPALAGKIVIAFACSAAAELGPALVAGGLKAFIGWTDKLVAVTDTPAAPWSRWMEPAVTYALLEGATAGAAHHELVTRLSGVLWAYKDGPMSQAFNAPFTWTTAFWNLTHLTLVGDPAAVVLP